MNDPRVRTQTIQVRTFVAHMTHIEIVWTEEVVQCVQPLNPFAVPTSRGNNAR